MTQNSLKPDFTDDVLGDDNVMICPVTGQPCMTEQDEHCEDYGCARKYGYDVDGEWS